MDMIIITIVIKMCRNFVGFLVVVDFVNNSDCAGIATAAVVGCSVVVAVSNVEFIVAI